MLLACHSEALQKPKNLCWQLVIPLEILRLKAQNDKLTTLPHRRETKTTQKGRKSKLVPPAGL
ncbi:hypothetical protein [Helicobacter marmotae]|uniref:hypothetical protein n=1 Tax=Helicobacter marmotae TaxID=152490 RepID=UPI0011C0704C|nr:hypothetical protein [Helicobacter marmotae]